MYSIRRQNSSNLSQEVHRSSKMTKSTERGSTESREENNISDYPHKEIYISLRRESQLSATTPPNQFKKCNVCSSTFRLQSQENKWWKVQTSLNKNNIRRYGDEIEYPWTCSSKLEATLAFIVMILLFGVLVLTLFWIVLYRDGLKWSNKQQDQFNWHPALMVTGFLTFSGFSTLLYRLCSCLKQFYVKLGHMILHTCTIPCATIGLMSILQSHNLANPPIANFRSLHSWLGLVTISLFSIQFILGFISFLLLLCCEQESFKFRASMLPLHTNLGILVFMLAIATSITGLSSLAAEFNNLANDFYNESIFINCLGVIYLFAAVAFILFLKLSKK